MTDSLHINFLQLSRQDVQKIIHDAQAAESQLLAQETAKVKQELEQYAQKKGFSISELFSGKQSKRHPSKSVQAQYQNPNDHSETWVGRGRKPNWLIAKLKKGGKLDEFKIGHTPSVSDKGKKVTAKRKAKYANPDNATETWTGMGRHPQWLVPRIKAGAKKEQFLII